jgi:hypothetical protein
MPFYITRSGILHATGAVISGNITAASGEIGGWKLNSTGFNKES